MNKRKVSAERTTAAKDTTRRPSVTSVQTRATAVPLQTRLSRLGKSPSADPTPNQGTMTKLSKIVLANENSNTAPPKTRFNSQDRSKELRSNSSPRLKSFPAERIRKFDNPALFDTNSTRAMMGQVNRDQSGRFSVPPTSSHNHEYGDHIRGMHHGHQQQSQMSENIYQQQIYPMNQAMPQADGALTYRVNGPDRHRPNVPHGHQSHVNPVAAPSSLAHVHNGPAPVAQSSTPATHIHAQQSQRNPRESTSYGQSQPDWVDTVPAQVVDLEKQPVGGRNLLLHRQAVMQERQQQQQMQTQSHPAIYSNATSQPTDGSMTVQHSQNNIQLLPYSTQENPRQVYQQLQNNMARQQQMQQRAFNQQMQMMSGQQQVQNQAQNNQGAYYNYFTQQVPGRQPVQYGMTSPQDATVNQARNGQNIVASMQQVQGNTGFPINQQNGATSSNQMPVDNPNARSQIRPYTINVVDGVKSQNVAHDHHNHGQVPQMYRQMMPGQSFPNHVQQQNMIPQNYVPQQVATTENPDMRSNDQTVANRGRNNLKFTPKMIRDQELLVATMKQQGISDELMRRQFDALLKEQRRQLEYLQQFQETSDLPDNRKVDKRRKIQNDEKPEWMAHITPPRISYSDFEKMNSKAKEESAALQQQQVNENQLVDYSGGQNNANNQQLMQSQHNAYHMWQQQNPNWQQQTGHPAGSSYNHAHLQPSQHQHQHVANNPTHPQYANYWQHQQNVQQPYQQQVYYQPTQQVSWQRDQPQNEEDTRFFKKAVSLNDLNARTCEPSSLLKLRLYKDVIRPQKRNNGLQDPETIQKSFEMLNSPESQKGLEYLANLNRKKQIAKLDGMQNPNEVTSDLFPAPPLDASVIPQRMISANGLENSRNPNNPLPQPLTYLKKSEIGGTMNEYPRQKQNSVRQRYSLMAEREDGTMAPTVQYQTSNPLTHTQQYNVLQQQNQQRVIPYNEKNPLSALNKSMPYKLDGSPPDHYHQMQNYFQNKQNMINNNGQGDVPSLNKSDTYTGVPYLDRPGGDTADLSHLKDNGQTQNKMGPYPPLGSSQRLNGSYNSPEIREAKTIGGVTYLARKPDYIPNQPLIPENALTANKYVQPAVIYN